MKRIDFYVQHLVKHQATEVILTSNSPIRFRFPDGERGTNQVIDHPQIAQMVQECAPPAQIEELKKSRRTSFAHVAEGGVSVRVDIEALMPQQWTVTVRKSGAAADRTPSPAGASPAAAAAAAGAAPAAAPSPEPASPSAPVSESSGEKLTAVEKAKVQVQSIAGEPKLNTYLRTMMAVGASDLHLSSDVVPMVRQSGEMSVLFKRPPIPDQEMRDMLFEVLPERNKAEFLERNDTDFAYPIEGLARFRMNYFRDRKGVGMVARQIPFEILSAQKLGLPPRVLELCMLSKGLVLVTGPTGSGKSTTLAALMDHVNVTRHDHIITIEDPIEFVHPNKNCLVNQREIGVHTSSFKSALRAALREDPDIVLVGEMRDLETIAIAVETAETGHLVFGTLHTTSAPSTVDRIIDQFPADRQEQIRTMLSESLRGVISQMLCKKKGGGRVATYEILIWNNAVGNLIREGKTFQLQSIMQTGRNQGMQTMNDHLLDLVKQDLVEPEEAYMKSNDKLQMKDLLAKANIQLKIAV